MSAARGLIVLVLALAACASSRKSPRLSDLETLARWMTGSFSSAAQAAADPDHFREVSLHTTRIWPDRPDGPWLYVEQALADAPDRPYRQRLYRLSTGRQRGTIESAVYELPGEPLVFAGAWKHPELLDAVTPDDLSPREGCTVVLRRSAGAFTGSTVGTGCPSALRGAAYATSQVRITAHRIISWDRGFDANNHQVWGAEHAGYIFLKD
jgi:hypothetical protein